MDKTFIRILQISDCHLLADKSKQIVGLNTYNSYSKVMDLVHHDINQINPDLIIFSGDISHDGSVDSYQNFISLVQDLNIPMIWLLGNHDSLDNGRQVLVSHGIKNSRSLIFDHWKFIFLNSQWLGHVAGNLESEELHALSQELKKYKDQNVLIFLHHPPIKIGCEWLDQQMVKNANEFFDVVNEYNNIRAVVFGHIHGEFKTKQNDVEFMSVPSTGFQFQLSNDHFALDALMPGYRWCNLYRDGHFETDVVRVDYDKSLLPDLECDGYQ